MNNIIKFLYKLRYRALRLFNNGEGSKRLIRIDLLIRLLFLLKQRNVTFKLTFSYLKVGDFRLGINSSDLEVYKQIFVDQEYKRTLEILNDNQVFKNSPILLDMGANIGLSASYFRKNIGKLKLYAFEPFERNFKRIPNEIESFQIGLWSKDAKLSIKRNFRDGKEWSVQVVEDRNGDINGKSLNTILTDLNIEVVDLLKVDIEGSEFEVFLNDKQMPENLKKVKAVVIEIHDECGDRNKLINFFKTCQFKHEPLGELDLFFKN